MRDPQIAFEDDALIAIDKPAGLLTVATETEKTDTAFVRLNESLRQRDAGRPFVVHRLDRDTSGLLLFARSAEARDRLQAAWDGVTKTYLAKGGHLMSIIGWIVLGIIIGFVASRVAHKKGRGIIPDIILGIAGSIVGGILFVELTAESVSRVNLHSLLAAIIGAILVLVAYHAIFDH